LSTSLQASSGTSVGAPAGWFFSLDCEANCDTKTIGADVGLTYGWPNALGGRPASLGVGTSGLFPYAEGYVQLATGRVPFGVGARFGLPLWSWRQHQLVARVDVPLGGDDTRLLLDPGLFVYEGNAPNGENGGHIVAFTQAVGVVFRGAVADFTPAVTLVAGHARHESSAFPAEAGRTTFATVSMGVTFHRRRK